MTERSYYPENVLNKLFLKGLCQLFLVTFRKAKSHLHQWKPENNNPVVLKVTTVDALVSDHLGNSKKWS